MANARLRYHLTPSGAVWMHQSEGRNHVLLDPRARSRVQSSDFARPIELWAAARWDGASSATVVRDDAPGVPDGPPARGVVVNRQTVVDFVGDVSDFRLSTLGFLIDAVASALDGGYPVVLAVPDAEQGALWIGAVSFFAPPATCLRLSFSTHESLADVLAGIEAENQRADKQLVESLSSAPGRVRAPVADENSWRTPIVSVVSQRDVEILRRRPDLPVILVDPRVESTVRVIGGADHRENQLGQTIPVTDWSRLALDASCEDFSALERCLQRLDEVSVNGPDDPGWPLAAAVAIGGDLPLALPTATRVILRDTPPGTQLEGELAATVSTLVSTTVDDAEQAWRRLSAALDERPARTALLQATYETYLRQAMQDDAWLMRGPVPLPGAVPFDDGLPVRLRLPAHAMTERLADAQGEVGTGVRVLRAIDLLHRLRLQVPGCAHPNDLNDLGTQAAQLLISEHGERIAELTGPIDAGALADWVVPPVSYLAPEWPQADRRPGWRLPPAVLGLLAAGLDPEAIAVLKSPKDLGDDPVAAEVACAITCGRMAGDSRLRGPAVEYLLHLATEKYGDDDPQQLVDDVFGQVADGQAWHATPLLRLMRRASVPVAGYLVPVIYAHVEDWAADEDGAKLAAALLKRVQFLPQRDRSGSLLPRRAGVADPDIPVLNLLAATGPGWLTKDDGLYSRAAEILMWAARAWDSITDEVRALIAPRVTVAAFMVALAAEPEQAGAVLRSRIGVVPVGGAWRTAVPLGLGAAGPMLRTMLSANNYRLTGELVCATVRSMLEPPTIDDVPDLPRLPELPVGPVVTLMAADDERVAEHLRALVEQELRQYDRRSGGVAGPVAGPGRDEVLSFWQTVLPSVSDPAVQAEPEHLPQQPVALWDALSVALGAGRTAVARADLRSLLDPRPDRSGRAKPGPNGGGSKGAGSNGGAGSPSSNGAAGSDAVSGAAGAPDASLAPQGAGANGTGHPNSPEPAANGAGLAANGAGLGANGASANGASANGASANGASANGASANGASANGASANGASANGTPQLNGATAIGSPNGSAKASVNGRASRVNGAAPRGWWQRLSRP